MKKYRNNRLFLKTNLLISGFVRIEIVPFFYIVIVLEKEYLVDSSNRDAGGIIFGNSYRHKNILLLTTNN
jgi:hypothetical protein